MSLNRRDLLKRTLVAATLPLLPSLDLFAVREAQAEVPIVDDEEESDDSSTSVISCSGMSLTLDAKRTIIAYFMGFGVAKLDAMTSPQIECLWQMLHKVRHP